jgi:hypothetical protein
VKILQNSASAFNPIFFFQKLNISTFHNLVPIDVFEKSFNICLLFMSSIKPCYQQLRQGGSLTARLFPIACLNRGLQIRLPGHAILDCRKELGFSLPSPKVVFLV